MIHHHWAILIIEIHLQSKFYRISAYRHIDHHNSPLFHHKIHKHHPKVSIKLENFELNERRKNEPKLYSHSHIRSTFLIETGFSGPFDTNYVSHFYSGKGKQFGFNASPESAISPSISISSVATSASEVSDFFINVLLFSFFINFWLRRNNFRHSQIHSTQMI